ncbi:uncharacterized protein LOC129593061 [Paramacrobiotus metropolitanus]|uniref:uncharacterized protein LOC129593061 n=1 Tax=Paramacrobiotus metropolitanus TaxID=2943436 RepID=UPI002445ADA1|nr:uncharacterized protein LOC129593061 [Paramacrobiotus metropolitanus]
MMDALVPETYGKRCQYQYGNTDYIGRGMFGAVYKAHVVERQDFDGDAVVAVKVIHLHQNSQLANNPQKWKRVRSRLQLLLSLRHINLVPYHKVTITGATGIVELMMDFYSGGDLATFLQQLKGNGGLLEQRSVIRFAQQITSGLHYLHQQNIIHGDIKPGNILIKFSEKHHEILLIGDLDDLIQMHRDATCSQDITQLRGTSRYMSPEMLSRFAEMPGEIPGRKTDIWSLGCVILELANSAMGLPGKLLQNSGEIVAVDGVTPVFKFITMMLNGARPFIDQSIPSLMASCAGRCLCVHSKDRIGADNLLLQLLNAEKGTTVSSEIAVLRIDMPDFAARLTWTDIDGSTAPVYKMSLSVQLLNTATVTLRAWPLPTALRNKQLCYGGNNFTTLGSEMVCQFLRSDGTIETIVWNIIRQSWRALNLSPRYFFVCPVGIGEKVYFWAKGKKFGVVHATENNIHLLPLPDGADHLKSISGGLSMDNKLIFYVLCIASGSTESLRIASFNILTYDWEYFPGEIAKRTNFAVTTLHRKIYVLGGEPADKRVLDSCLRFDLVTQSWETLGSLVHNRFNHGAFVVNENIYVCGGRRSWQDYYPLLQMERYDMEKNVWIEDNFQSLENKWLPWFTQILTKSYYRTDCLPLFDDR